MFPNIWVRQIYRCTARRRPKTSLFWHWIFLIIISEFYILGTLIHPLYSKRKYLLFFHFIECNLGTGRSKYKLWEFLNLFCCWCFCVCGSAVKKRTETNLTLSKNNMRENTFIYSWTRNAYKNYDIRDFISQTIKYFGNIHLVKSKHVIVLPFSFAYLRSRWLVFILFFTPARTPWCFWRVKTNSQCMLSHG